MLNRTSSPANKLIFAALLGALLLIASAAVAAESVVAQGSSWDKRSAKVEGSWKIVDRDGDLFLVLDQKFKTKKAPDLKAFLTKQPATGIDKKNLPAGAVRLGLLKSHKGSQELAIPAGTSLKDLRTLMIHCEKYSKVWAVTSLY